MSMAEKKCVGVKIVLWSDVPEKAREQFSIPEHGYVEKRFFNPILTIEYKAIGDSIAESLLKDLNVG
jgi:hypothetical protein